ncbi:MAG: ankyrin repeat domain-containing protein [Synergistaceae bacterium]|nr:ankyrin repeat domain-containing protein [Synergistaceae bacterium]
MRKLLLFSLLICLTLSLPAYALTEHEFKAVCRRGSVQELREVIKANPNFAEIRFREMDTPLIIAADKITNPEFLQIIVNTGIDLNAQNEDGETALMELMDEPVSLACVNVLLKAGANPNVTDEDGKTALMKALDDDLPPDIISALLDAGADAKLRDRKSRGVIDYYSRKAYRLQGTEVMKRLEAAAK